MACSWSADSKSLTTSSADCTVKLCVSLLSIANHHGIDAVWPGDVETRKCTTSWTVGSGVDHQQVGNTWTPSSGIASLSLGGDLNIFDPRVGDKASKIFSVCIEMLTLAIANQLVGTAKSYNCYCISVVWGNLPCWLRRRANFVLLNLLWRVYVFDRGWTLKPHHCYCYFTERWQVLLRRLR